MYKGQENVKVESKLIENMLMNVRGDIDKFINKSISDKSKDVLDIIINIREDRKSALVTIIYKDV